MTFNQTHGTGWRRDIYDPRDFRATASKEEMGDTPLPSAVELWTPPIVDQLSTSSCVGQATASLFRYTMRLWGEPDYQISSLFNYWLARHVPRRGWENEDMGAMPRDAMQSMISNGVIPEELWPFSEDPTIVNQRPPQELLAKAKSKRIVEGKYVRMLANDNLFHLKNSLAHELPFLVGVDIYSSFYDTKSDGMVPMHQTNEEYIGGHLIYCNGYDDSMRRFRCPNSWGTGWGATGVGWIPYEYIGNRGLAGDFWRIEAIT